MEISSAVMGLESELECMREYFKSGKTKSASWRLSQLKGLLLFVEERKTEIFKALKQDLGKHHVEAFRDEVKFIYLYVLFLKTVSILEMILKVIL